MENHEKWILLFCFSLETTKKKNIKKKTTRYHKISHYLAAIQNNIIQGVVYWSTLISFSQNGKSKTKRTKKNFFERNTQMKTQQFV